MRGRGTGPDAGVPESQEAFAAFLDTHYDRIFAYAWRILGNAPDAEDVTQEVCMSLPRRLQGFRGECAITTWLYRIVTNAAIDRIRRNRSAEAAGEGWAEVESMTREADRERAEGRDWLRRALRELPDELRVTAALLVDDEMTQAEAAEILDVKPGTVAWRMSEIKRKLRDRAAEEAAA